MAVKEVRFQKARAYASYCYEVGSRVDLDNVKERLSLPRLSRVSKEDWAHSQALVMPSPPVTFSAPVSLWPLQGSSCDEVELSFYDIGVVVLSFVIPFQGSFSQWIELSQKLCNNAKIEQKSIAILETHLQSIKDAISDPIALSEGWAYNLFCVDELSSPCDINELEETYPDEFAKCLRGTFVDLSEEEVDDALLTRASYTEEDFVVIDHNAAFLVGGLQQEIRQVLEVAMVQVLNYQWLSQDLDRMIDLGVKYIKRPNSFFPLSPVRHEELRQIDPYCGLAADQMAKTERLLQLRGGRYLGRVYSRAYDKLGLDEISSEITEKINHMGDLYQHLHDNKALKSTEKLEWLIIVMIGLSAWLSFFHR